MISQEGVTDALTEANKNIQQLSEQLKQANDEKQKLATSLSATKDENQQCSEQLKQANDEKQKLAASVSATKCENQYLLEELKQDNHEKQKLSESLLEANSENQQLTLQLLEANTLLQTLRTENEEQAKSRERSTELIQKNLHLLRETKKISSEKEELEKTLQHESQTKEELAKQLEEESEKRKLAQKNEKELEEEMERWLVDVKSERFTNTNTFNNLSECLNRETQHRRQADITRELTDKEKDKLEYLLREEQIKCKQLEIEINKYKELETETKTQAFKINQLLESNHQIRTELNEKLEKEKYETKLIINNLKMSEERLTTVKQTVLELKHEKEVIEKEHEVLKNQLGNEKRRIESLINEGEERANKLHRQQEELVLTERQLESVAVELKQEKHEKESLKNLQNELAKMATELNKEKTSKRTLEEHVKELEDNLNTGIS